MHIMLFYKQNFFIYIISLNPFNNPIFKTKKLIIRIRETVSGHTSEFDDAKSQKWGPRTVKPLILYHSLRTWLPGSSNTLDQALRGVLPQSPSAFSMFLGGQPCLLGYRYSFPCRNVKSKIDTTSMAQDMWFDSSQMKYFYIHKRLAMFSRSHSLDSVSRKLPRVMFYNRKIKYVKTLTHKSEKLVGGYSQ